MKVSLVALLSALVPFVAVNATYLLAAAYGQVDWCFPYLESCASISAAGRQPPASYLFRATMLPTAVILGAYWWLNHAWLGALQRRQGGTAIAVNNGMLVLGLLACVGLILYVTVLGEEGSAWARQRRIGTVLFFSFTYIAQLLLLSQLRQLRGQLPTVPELVLRAMGVLCITLLAVGVLTVILQAWDRAWYVTVEDAFEWVLALMLQLNFLLGYLVWRLAGWTLEVRVS